MMNNKSIEEAIVELRSRSFEYVERFFDDLFNSILQKKRGCFCEVYNYPEDFRADMYNLDLQRIFSDNEFTVEIYYNGKIRVTLCDSSSYKDETMECIEKFFEKEGFTKATIEEKDQIFFTKRYCTNKELLK